MQIADMEKRIAVVILGSNEEYENFFKKEILPKVPRKDFYNAIVNLIKKHEDDEAVLQELYEIELFLIGHCSDAFICRFINEPENHEELVSYVRSLLWK